MKIQYMLCEEHEPHYSTPLRASCLKAVELDLEDIESRLQSQQEMDETMLEVIQESGHGMLLHANDILTSVIAMPGSLEDEVQIKYVHHIGGVAMGKLWLRLVPLSQLGERLIESRRQSCFTT